MVVTPAVTRRILNRARAKAVLAGSVMSSGES
jgi:hypothetical protein